MHPLELLQLPQGLVLCRFWHVGGVYLFSELGDLFREFVTFITEYLAIPAPTRQVPAGVAKAAAVVLESAARAAGAKRPPPLNRSRLRFLYYNQHFSIEKARRELGYDPRISYREGLPRALDWVSALERSNGSSTSSSGEVRAHELREAESGSEATLQGS